ncbi:ataxin-2-like protein [Stegodyphus dumicola]|uniref:ataxin-2-like protein n=1 Tax=Stegodyphus dumicola TaxID=202533 RepID=UPI0015AE4069|nr:ataxin-2-like protein [Stegodyphus dumicola]XP_035224738.1 ataxin-2-like protein [Stegodyphus dumicola]
MMSLNSNKRKGRTNANSKLGRSKGYNEKIMAFDGVYGNSRLMHTTASLVGCVVQIQVKNGSVYEGILRTFSHQFDLVLEMTHKVNLKSPPAKGVGPVVCNLLASFPFEEGVSEKLIFRLNDIVMLKAANVDTDYAVKDNFTDTAISKYNGQIIERELEPWEGASSDSETTVALIPEDEDGANGWDANDMFRTNAEKYGVKSSYDNSLQEYTVPLTKKDTEEYKLQEAKALKIAHEIEANVSYQTRIQLENGDEEDRFSAVARPDDAVASKYVLPQKRRNTPGLKRQPSTTASPVHTTSSKPYPTLHLNTNVTMSTSQTNKQYIHTLPASEKSQSPPSFHSSPGPNNATMPMPSVPKDAVEKSSNGEGMSEKEAIKTSSVSTTLENVPALSGHSKPHVLCPPPTQTLPPRIERRRETERKLSKQKGRNDEIEEFKKFSSNFKLTDENRDSNEPKDEFQSSELKTDQAMLAEKLAEQVKIDKDIDEKSANVVKFSNLNPNAKEFVFNPNAKSFTPRSASVTSPPTPIPVQPQRMQAQSPVMAVPHSQMIPGLPQPIFTAMAPQYVMQAAPVSMALTTPFAAASLSQAPRFRKVPITMQPRHEITPPMHVAAATGQPILAPAAIPTPSQLTMQYTSPPGMIHASGPPQQTMGYPQMNFVVGPRVVSPQPVGVVPTSHSVSYCDTSHLPTHLINKYCIAVSAHPGASISAATASHSLQQGGQHSNHYPPQSQTPVVHPSPSPVHQVQTPHGNHSQPSTPTTVMYPGGPIGQHPLQATGPHNHNQPLNHPMHQAHHTGFPGGPQPVVLMQQQQPVPVSHHGHQTAAPHHPLHMHSIHSQNPGNHIGTPTHILPQMTIIPTSAAMVSAPTTIATPPFVQHPQGV